MRGVRIGYSKLLYFSRVFKQVTLTTPMDFRKSVERPLVGLEWRPRTIFATSWVLAGGLGAGAAWRPQFREAFAPSAQAATELGR